MVNGVPSSRQHIEQGDIFWVDIDDPYGSEPGGRRPYVVVQNNMYNFTRISTVVACAITANLKRESAPGNVMAAEHPGREGNLPRKSVVNISQVITLDKQVLSERIGFAFFKENTGDHLRLAVASEPREP